MPSFSFFACQLFNASTRSWTVSLDQMEPLTTPIATSEGMEAMLLGACNVESFEEVEELPQAPEQESIMVYSEEESEDVLDDKECEWNDDDMTHTSSGVQPNSSFSSACQGLDSSWVDSINTTKSKNKLIRILKGQDMIPQKRWGIDRILATLVEHRADPELRTSYRQFKKFAYQTMIHESKTEVDRWPEALDRKDCKTMMNIRLQSEIERCYSKEIQTLCKTTGFGITSKTRPGDIDCKPLETIMETAHEKAPMLASLMAHVGQSAHSAKDPLQNMKLLAILAILC